jgi:hypothetical protein
MTICTRPFQARFKEHQMLDSRFAIKGAKVCTAATTVVLMLAGPTALSASIITGSLAFTASGFPEGAPVDPISGLVSYSFDNSANFFNAGDGSTSVRLVAQTVIE